MNAERKERNLGKVIKERNGIEAVGGALELNRMDREIVRIGLN